MPPLTASTKSTPARSPLGSTCSAPRGGLLERPVGRSINPKKNDTRMTTSEKVRILSDLSTRDEAGRHFTSRFNSDDIASLEAEGLIAVSRPIHEPTGIPYGEEYYSVSITEDGVELVDANPEDNVRLRS